MAQNLESLSDEELEAIIAGEQSGGLESMSDEELEMIASGESPSAPSSDIGRTESALRGAAQGATFSLQPYLSGALESKMGDIQGAVTGKSAYGDDLSLGQRLMSGVRGFSPSLSFSGDNFDRSVATQLGQREEAREANPVSFGAAQLGGALLTAPVTGIGGGAVKAAQTAKLGRQAIAMALAKDALVDGAIGAAENVAAEAPTTVPQFLENALVGGAISAGTSGLLRAPALRGAKDLAAPSISRQQVDAIEEGIDSAVIRARAAGATAKDLRGTNRSLARSPIVKAAKELEAKKFFQSGQAQYNVEAGEFEKIAKGYLPPSQEELLVRTEEGIQTSAEELKKVLGIATKELDARPELGLNKIKSSQLTGFSALENQLEEALDRGINSKGLRKASRTLKEVKRAIDSNEGASLLELQSIKQDLGLELGDKTFMDRDAVDKNMMRGLYSILKEGIEEKAQVGIRAAGNQDSQLLQALNPVMDLNKTQSQLFAIQDPLSRALGKSRGTNDLPSVTNIVSASGASYLMGPQVGIPFEVGRSLLKSPRGMLLLADLSDTGKAFVRAAKAKPMKAMEFVQNNFPEQAVEAQELVNKGVPQWQVLNAIARQPSVLSVFEKKNKTFSYNDGLGEFEDPQEAKTFLDDKLQQDSENSIDRASQLTRFLEGLGL